MAETGDQVSQIRHLNEALRLAFDDWSEVVSNFLELYVGFGLADLDVPEWKLRVWWQAGVPSRIVASALTTQTRRVRWSLPVELQISELQRLRAVFQSQRIAS